MWLEEELKNYKRILVIISHSQDFMNGVCTNIINLDKKKLNLYTGNYDAFIKTRDELQENQMKRYNWEQAQIAHMKVSCFDLIQGHFIAKPFCDEMSANLLISILLTIVFSLFLH